LEVLFLGSAFILFVPGCRLDRLREVVPHAERANTAAFLETVIDYVTQLKAKVAALEAQIAGVPPLPLGQIVGDQGLGQQAPATQVLAPKIYCC
jgi:hypothetical protein